LGPTSVLSPTPVAVLVVEDNPVDARMVQFALDEVKDWPVQVSVVEDGDEAFEYLQRTGEYKDAVRPEVVVLDLNLPKRNGTEVLKMIRNSKNLRDLKVIVLSSSPLDVIEGQLRENLVEPDCCFTKPIDLDEFLAIGSAIRQCYFGAGGCP
jgi:chemotaxis family two-component system response regulator Rcp1